MRRFVYLIILLVVFTNCEDIIEIDAPGEKPRLIVDALLRVDTTKPTIVLQVKVSLTNPYFGEIPATNLEQISLLNFGKPSTFFDPNFAVLLETEPGVYEREVGHSLFDEGKMILQINYEDEVYLAYAYLVQVNYINRIRQVERDDGKTEIAITFKDQDYQEDFYLFDFGFGEFVALDDVAMNGERFTFSHVYDHDIEPGTEVSVSIMGIDRPFYNYLNLLLDQSSDEIDLFSTPVATLRGNIINATGIDNEEVFDNVTLSDNYALGYFAIAQTYTRTITIE